MPVATRTTLFPDLSPKQAARRVRRILRCRGYGTFVEVNFLCFALACETRDIERVLGVVSTEDFPVSVTGLHNLHSRPDRCSLRWVEPK